MAGIFQRMWNASSFFFIANDIGQISDTANSVQKKEASKKKKAFFILFLSRKTYGTLKDLVSPKTMGKVTYHEVAKTLAEHFWPKLSKTVAAFKFRSCNQIDEEAVIDFVTRLKRLASYCDIGTYLDRALCEHYSSLESEARILRRNC